MFRLSTYFFVLVFERVPFLFPDLVIDLIVQEPSHEVFFMTIQLAKALLHEGNTEAWFSKIIILQFC